jgi:hypothetical protein
VARAFHSTGDEKPVLALTTALYDGNERIGVLSGWVRARATFGAVQMNCGAQGHCMTALLGPRDRDHRGDPLPDSIYLLAAPGLADGQELMLDSTSAHAICKQLPCEPAATGQFDVPDRPRGLVLDDYEDPISHVRSLAAFAPVGRTGLIVVVATPNDALDAITMRMVDRIKTFLWVPLAIGLVLLACVIVWPDRRSLPRAR